MKIAAFWENKEEDALFSHCLMFSHCIVHQQLKIHDVQSTTPGTFTAHTIKRPPMPQHIGNMPASTCFAMAQHTIQLLKLYNKHFNVPGSHFEKDPQSTLRQTKSNIHKLVPSPTKAKHWAKLLDSEASSSLKVIT